MAATALVGASGAYLAPARTADGTPPGPGTQRHGRRSPEIWLGRRDLLGALRSGTVQLVGRSEVVSCLPDALQLSPVAGLVAAATSGRR